MTLPHAHLYLCQQQQQTADCHQHHHHLQRAAHLLQYLPDLLQDRADIQQTHRRKFPVKLSQHAVTVLPAEAGQPALWLPVQRTRREDKEEVGPQAFPVHLAQAGHSGAEVLCITGKSHAVPQPDVQALRQPLFHRHFTRFRRPGASGNRVVIGTLLLPGQIQLAVKCFVCIALRRLAVDLRQTRANNRVERLRHNVVL